MNQVLAVALLFVGIVNSHLQYLQITGCLDESEAHILTTAYGISVDAVHQLESQVVPILTELEESMEAGNVDHANIMATAEKLNNVVGSLGLLPPGVSLQPIDFSNCRTVQDFCSVLVQSMKAVAKTPAAFLEEQGVSSASELLQISIAASRSPDPMLAAQQKGKNVLPRLRGAPDDGVARWGPVDNEQTRSYFKNKEGVRKPRGRGNGRPYARAGGVRGSVKSNNVEIQLPDNVHERLRGKKYGRASSNEKGAKVFSWSGVSADGSVFLLERNGDAVVGTIDTPDGKFFVQSVNPVGDDDSADLAITAIDQNSYPVDDANTGESQRQSVFQRVAVAAQNAAAAKAMVGVEDNNVWVGIAYSATALSKIQTGTTSGGTNTAAAFLQLAMTEANQGLINTGITTLQLTYTLVTYWQTTDVSDTQYTDTMLTRWETSCRTSGSECFTKRDQLGLDIVLYVTDLSDWCGKASDIKADANEGFAVVDVDCATGYYSTAHEMAHLFGCRHDTSTDSTATPYAYGHGHYISTGKHRTIMAYPSGSYNRVNYWSDDTATYPYLGGNYKLGDASTRDNARVLRERASAIDAFRQDGCFGADNQVRVLEADGSVASVSMKDLRVGQTAEVMNERTGARAWSRVIAFLDRQTDKLVPMLDVHTANSTGVLQLTFDHVVFRATTGGWETVMAEHLTVGDNLLLMKGDTYQTVAVTELSISSSEGFFAPLTQAGNLVVNGIVASSYANIDHTLAQYLFKPPFVVADMLGALPAHAEGLHPFASAAKAFFNAGPTAIRELIGYTCH